MPAEGCARAPLKQAAIHSATAATTSGRATALCAIMSSVLAPDEGWAEARPGAEWAALGVALPGRASDTSSCRAGVPLVARCLSSRVREERDQATRHPQWAAQMAGPLHLPAGMGAHTRRRQPHDAVSITEF